MSLNKERETESKSQKKNRKNHNFGLWQGFFLARCLPYMVKQKDKDLAWLTRWVKIKGPV